VRGPPQQVCNSWNRVDIIKKKAGKALQILNRPGAAQSKQGQRKRKQIPRGKKGHPGKGPGRPKPGVKKARRKKFEKEKKVTEGRSEEKPMWHRARGKETGCRNGQTKQFGAPPCEKSLKGKNVVLSDN